MDIGTLVRYKHDLRKTGVIISINNYRAQLGDRYLVLWGDTRETRGVQQWHVHPDWIEEVDTENG